MKGARLQLCSEGGRWQPCMRCRGVGTIPGEEFLSMSLDKWVRGGGVLPCPECKGKKVVWFEDAKGNDDGKRKRT